VVAQGQGQKSANFLSSGVEQSCPQGWDAGVGPAAEFVVFTVVREEQPYIEEFVQYHLFIGVDLIYIYGAWSWLCRVSARGWCHLRSLIEVHLHLHWLVATCFNRDACVSLIGRRPHTLSFTGTLSVFAPACTDTPDWHWHVWLLQITRTTQRTPTCSPATQGCGSCTFHGPGSPKESFSRYASPTATPAASAGPE
jgi:hypothetical protein